MAITYPRRIVEHDPITDEVTYEFTQQEGSGGFFVYVASATDYDIHHEHPWSSYSITQVNTGAPYDVSLTKVEALMDEGSTVLETISQVYGLGGFSYPDRYVWTAWDARGRLDMIVEDFGNYYNGQSRPDYSHRATDYDPVTGFADYSHTVMRTGQQVSIDYDSATGLFDYVYILDRDGHSLSQDYTEGQLDYQIESMADGRMIITDFDLLDAHSWSSYAIAYSAAGAIDGVTVL